MIVLDTHPLLWMDRNDPEEYEDYEDCAPLCPTS
jgi:hypothetical protein